MKWPTGVRSSGLACGIKSAGGLDLGLIAAERPVVWAGTFTRNAAAAAPVVWSRSMLGSKVRAIVVNSGNANACTGPEGEAAVVREAEAVAEHLGCSPAEVLVASTGPIGVPLPVDLITGSIGDAAGRLVDDPTPFARSILTTDTVTKIATAPAGDATVVGVAKGAAMLAPNMATMLAFLATDAEIDQPSLAKVLDAAVSRSFNRISVDSCESTNDSVFALATGEVASDVNLLAEAIELVCRDLALAMVRDAEGGSRVLHIVVDGASDEDAACVLARSIADSALWRAALHGGDPNWGRVLAAMGSVDPDLDLSQVEVEIGGVALFAGGAPTGDVAAAVPAMNEPEVTLRCGVGTGAGVAEFWTCDLSPDYVALNAAGTT